MHDNPVHCEDPYPDGGCLTQPPNILNLVHNCHFLYICELHNSQWSSSNTQTILSYSTTPAGVERYTGNNTDMGLQVVTE